MGEEGERVDEWEWGRGSLMERGDMSEGIVPLCGKRKFGRMLTGYHWPENRTPILRPQERYVISMTRYL